MARLSKPPSTTMQRFVYSVAMIALLPTGPDTLLIIIAYPQAKHGGLTLCH